MIEKAMEGPIKKSTTSVFDSLNTNIEATVFYQRYQKAHYNSTRETVAYISILGMSEAIELENIYTPTKISTSIHSRLYKQDWHDINDKVSIIKSKKSHKTIKALDYVEENRKVIILGAPGAGKTTFSKYLTLANIDDSLFKTSGLKKRYFPFYISLPAYSEVMDIQAIEDYIYSKLIKMTDSHAKTYVKNKLKKNNTILILDSLDEVPQEKKKNILSKINELCEYFTNIKVIVTCRVSDYEGGLNSFNEVEIARLSKEAINKIIKAWFFKDHKKAKELQAHIKVDEDIYSLTETPLLLSLICIQFKHDLNIPKRKTELYGRCIDALLRTWDTSRGFRRDTLFASLSDNRKEKIFEHIAYKFMQDDFSYLFKRDLLIKTLCEKLEQFDEVSTEDASNVLNEIESHHGILEQYSAETYFFSHPSFQEYFVAKALISKRKEIEFVKKHNSDIRANSIIPFVLSMSEEPMDIIRILVSTSDMKSTKNYPAMAKRTIVLHLLYKSILSGIAIKKSEKEILYKHIIETQINITNIYSKGGVYPIAILEHDGVKHTYYYSNKRPTLYEALQPYRRLATEILLSPCSLYSNIALQRIEKMTYEKNDYIKIGVILCLIIPLVKSNPIEVEAKLLELSSNTTTSSLQEIIKLSIDNLKFHTSKESR